MQRLVHLWGVTRRMKAQAALGTASTDNPLGRVLHVYEENPTTDVETLELKLDEAILSETPALERGNAFVKVVSVAAPLLGLLGTVTGMIQTFQAITLFGTGDPKLMAGGISQALVTTVLGLTVAIPLLLIHALLSGQSRALVEVLEEQTAGYIARHAERLKAGGGDRA
jgi:biopolymer transport protein ExbB